MQRGVTFNPMGDSFTVCHNTWLGRIIPVAVMQGSLMFYVLVLQYKKPFPLLRASPHFFVYLLPRGSQLAFIYHEVQLCHGSLGWPWMGHLHSDRGEWAHLMWHSRIHSAGAFVEVNICATSARNSFSCFQTLAVACCLIKIGGSLAASHFTLAPVEKQKCLFL